jgi:hypothetical protein
MIACAFGEVVLLAPIPISVASAVALPETTLVKESAIGFCARALSITMEFDELLSADRHVPVVAYVHVLLLSFSKQVVGT